MVEINCEVLVVGGSIATFSTNNQPSSQESYSAKSTKFRTSQFHARETQFECPNCGSHYNMEIDYNSRILYVVGAGTRIYAKKHRCMNCDNEWAD